MKSVQKEPSRKLDMSFKKKKLTKTFNFDDELKVNIFVTENNKEKHVITFFIL
jgi:hypothetical protein